MRKHFQWISAKRELPTPFVTVITHNPISAHEPVHVGYYDSINKLWYDAHSVALQLGTVTHWRDLPNPPSA